ncbi:MAG: LemA family protein [Ginsengibacter sp.]
MEVLFLPLGIFILVIVVIVLFNRLTNYKKKVDNSWRDLRSVFQKRIDLLKDLLEMVQLSTVTGKEISTKIIEIQKETVNFKRMKVEQFVQLNHSLNNTLEKFFSNEEYKSELQINTKYQELYKAFIQSKGDLENAGKKYNLNVQNFNSILPKFPTSMMASMAGYHAREMFDAGLNDHVSKTVTL